MPDMPAGQLSVDHLGIVAWIENSRGTRFSLSQTRYEGNHVAVTINLGNNSFRGPATRPYACFRILWKGAVDQCLPRAAICRVSVSPTIDKAGHRITDATTYHIMDPNLADTQSDVYNGGKSGFLLMPIRPDNNGSTLLASSRLQINLLRQDVSATTISKIKAAGRWDLSEDEKAIPVVDPPYATFDFAFHFEAGNMENARGGVRKRDALSTTDEAQSSSGSAATDHSSGTAKKRRTDKAIPSKPQSPCNTRKASRASGPSKDIHSYENAAPTGDMLSEKLALLQNLKRTEKQLEDKISKTIQMKEARIEKMRDILGQS